MSRFLLSIVTILICSSAYLNTKAATVVSNYDRIKNEQAFESRDTRSKSSAKPAEYSSFQNLRASSKENKKHYKNTHAGEVSDAIFNSYSHADNLSCIRHFHVECHVAAKLFILLRKIVI